MALGDLPIFTMLRTKMSWHQTRQRVLAENVSNADTPDYRGRDLKQLDFSDHLHLAQPVPVTATVTNEAHFAGMAMSSPTAFDTEKLSDFETTPDGNDVTLEEQMMKVTGNQMDYQAATTLYSRGLGMLRSAIASRA